MSGYICEHKEPFVLRKEPGEASKLKQLPSGRSEAPISPGKAGAHHPAAGAVQVYML